MRKPVGLTVFLLLAGTAAAEEKRFDAQDVLTPVFGDRVWSRTPAERLVAAVGHALPAGSMAAVRVDEGRWLVVDGDAAAVAASGRVLAEVRAGLQRQIRVGVRVVRATPATFAAVPGLTARLAAADFTGRPLELSDADAAALVSASPRTNALPQLTSVDEEKCMLSIFSEQPYARALNVYPAQDGRPATTQAVMDTFRTGVTLNVWSSVASNGTAALSLRLETTDLAAMDAVHRPDGDVQRPRGVRQLLGAVCAVPRGRTVLLAGTEAVPFGANATPEPVLLLVTAEPVDATPATRPAG